MSRLLTTPFGTLTAPAVRPLDDEHDDGRRIVARVAARDAAALAALYDRHARGVFSLALRVVGDQADAEDVVPEVFSQAWRQAERYDAARGTVVGWLLSLAFETHLAGCEACRMKIRQFSPGVAALAGAVPQVTRRPRCGNGSSRR